MAKEKQLREAEAFVRKVLAVSFNQKADAETVRSVALRVSRVVAENAPKTSSDTPKKRPRDTYLTRSIALRIRQSREQMERGVENDLQVWTSLGTDEL
jgi:hypothetical protein